MLKDLGEMLNDDYFSYGVCFWNYDGRRKRVAKENGFLREPNSIHSYASLACIAIQSNQNDMFGGQSINAFCIAVQEHRCSSVQSITIWTLYLKVDWL